MTRYLAISLLLLATFSAVAAAQVPPAITYQGVLYDKATNAPIADGSHTIDVSFFPTADTIGIPLLTSRVLNVQTSKGLFSIIVPVDATMFSRQIYLAVRVDNSGFIGKATPVTSTPYAFYSHSSDTATYSQRALRANVADSLAGGVSSVTRQSIGAAGSGINADITALNALTKPLTIAQGGTGAANATTARANLGVAASGANNDITSLNALTGSFTVAQGGTGATTAASARTNLGAAASGANADITSLTGLTTPLTLAQGGTSATTAAAARTNLGLGTIATQASNGVTISGGSIDGVPVGAVTSSSGSFTTLQNTGNVYTLGTETDNALPGNIVNVTGTVPIAIIQTGTATGPITANVALGIAGQWLYIVNRSNFTVTFAATAINPNTAVEFLNVTGAWMHVQ
jgi:hypothetical protein